MDTDLKKPIWTCNYRVIYADTDAAGVVYYGNYLKFFEIGRTEYLRGFLNIAYRDLEKQGLLFPVTESYCRYKSPARYDDKLTIFTSLTKISKVSLNFTYEIREQSEDKLLVIGCTRHAAVNPSGKLSPMPSDFITDIKNLIGQTKK